MIKTVNDIVRGKGTQVWSVSPDTLVFEALKLMAEKNIGAVAVLDKGRVVGILSERDYARKVILKGQSSKTLPVKAIMVPKVLYVTLEQTVDDCMALMTDKRIRHLPVMANDKIVGLISIGDVVKAVIAEKDFMIQQLEKYITGA